MAKKQNGEKREAERTGDDIVCQEPIAVVLAGREYKIPVLPYIKNKAWREKFKDYQREILPVMKIGKSEDDPDKTLEHLDILCGFQDGLIDLLFAYWQECDKAQREELESTCTEYDLFIAAQKVVASAGPLSLKPIPKPSGRR